MFAGHFGVAAAIKSKTPETPLWALMVSSQLLDIVFFPLAFLGIESMEAVAGDGYGGLLIFAPYSHSLVSAIIISMIAALIAFTLWGKRSGLVIAAVTISHWILDLVVHRPDLAVLPGNLGDLPLLGLGLWNYPIATFITELVLLAVGILLYSRYKIRFVENKRKGYIVSGMVALILVGSLLIDIS